MIEVREEEEEDEDDDDDDLLLFGTGDLYMDFLKPKSNSSKEPFSRPQKTIFEAVSGISRSS